MNRVVLFSPVGGTDPIPQTNWRDGSLLHICRHYQPTEVYLYMSAEILELHKSDNRYLYCLEKLAALQNRSMKYHIIERPDLKDVQLFDAFYDDFRHIILDIAKDFDESDTLLLNVSSGTPAMKSSLLVLATLGEYPVRMIQVTTPLKKMNEHQHKDYDVKLLWEVNEDNAENSENRCHEVRCPTLSQIKQEEIIKKLVLVYDYAAALEVAKTLPEATTKKYLPFLELAYYRLQLNFPKLNILANEIGGDIIPIKDEERQKLFEYALNMDIKRKKEEYTDFVRAITPLVVDLFILIIKNECNIDINHCVKKVFITKKDHENKEYQRRVLYWQREKLISIYPEVDELLNQKFNEFKYKEVYSSALVDIIGKFAENKKVGELASKIRIVEEKVRNRAAHEIVSLSDKAIKNMLGFSVEDIMTSVKKAFKYTGLGITQKHWDSYDTMNQKILAAMG
ncbi:MAG: hypothetical protein J6O04_10570 [Selenomonadaceae bacterium]|nr:hypothetical protein [Selenomonadaceae bacterium]